MCKRFVEQGSDEQRAVSGEPALLRMLLPSMLVLALTACGSAPEKTDAPVATAVAPATQAPAVTTTPIAPAPEVSTKAPASKAKVATADAATAVPVVEAPIPPEAQQQFDSAVSAMNSGNLAGAEQQFRSLGTAYPAYSGPLLNLSILQVKAGKLDDAEKTLQSAIERNPSAAAYNQLGIVHRRLGRFKDADAAYQQAVQIDPSYALAYLNLGVLCDLYLQQPQRALEAYERYLELSSAPDAKVAGWVTELKARLGSAQRSAQAES